MKDTSVSPLLRVLAGAACIVIVVWGIRAAAAVLSPLLLGLLAAYAILPFPKWIVERFKVSKSVAIALTAVAVLAFVLFLLLPLDFAAVRISQRLPLYEQLLSARYQQFGGFMAAHDLSAPTISIKSVLTPDRLREATRIVLPEAGAIISSGVLISFLAFLFVAAMVEDTGVTRGPLAEKLAYYGSAARSYVMVTAKSASINAVLNLIFLSVMGVDTPVLWAAVYFVLDFIPTVGFIAALLPPTFVTLLMYGWKRALVVAIGLVLTNLLIDNLVTPIFMKHAVDVSLLEITLSLMGWTFLLGVPGAILAIPLTLALKKFIDKELREEAVAVEPAAVPL